MLFFVGFGFLAEQKESDGKLILWSMDRTRESRYYYSQTEKKKLQHSFKTPWQVKFLRRYSTVQSLRMTLREADESAKS